MRSCRGRRTVLLIYRAARAERFCRAPRWLSSSWSDLPKRLPTLVTLGRDKRVLRSSSASMRDTSVSRSIPTMTRSS